MKKFVKDLVKTVKDRGYNIKMDNDCFYTEIDFIKTGHPEYNKLFSIEHSYEEPMPDDCDICEYRVQSNVKTKDLVDKTKEEIIELFKHQDQLEEFVNMLNKYEVTFEMLEKDDFYLALFTELKEQGMKILK